MNILEQYSDKINGTLETFDRMIINGYIRPFQNTRHFLFYLIQNNIQLKEFDDYAQKCTEELCTYIEKYCQSQDCEITYLNSGKISKDELASKKFEENPKEGLIAAFTVVEVCKVMSVKYQKDTGKLYPEIRGTKCKHYYLYFNDIEFGWMFIKIQTWFPYNVQIYINGHSYLAKLLDKNTIEYQMYNNSFAYIDDFQKAQELANGILSKRISDSFDGIVNKLNPHLPNIKEKLNHSYFWCVDQCEFATDITFKTRSDLDAFYKNLVETAYFTLSSEDIYSFFGRKISHIDKFTKGDIVADLRHRYQGYRIKFKINSNQVKMYDKGNSLRIEVTINNPYDFKILKTKEDDSTGEIITTKHWVPMGKSIVNLYRYAEISRAIIKRFIEALPVINSDSLTPLNTIQSISTSKVKEGRKYSGFNLLNKETLALFSEIANGDYLINGFTNKTVRKAIFEDSDSSTNRNRMTRIISKLKAHGLIKKVSKKNKYYLTVEGRKITSSILLYAHKELA